MAPGSSSRPERKSEESDDERPWTGTTNRRHSHYESQRTGRSPRPTSGASQYASSRSQGRRASYEEPLDFQNLDEVAAPEPLGPAKTDSLEQERSPDPVRRRASGRQQEQELSETAAPAPVSQPTASSSGNAQNRRLLDDQEAGDADDESSTTPPPFGSRKPEDYVHKEQELPSVPRWLTELYTISYLIFFSILGTLGRLGIQWLTFYPGAPVVTPVIWANFAGALFMGFLSEDQALFRDAWSSPPTAANEKRESAQSKMSDEEAHVRAERAKRKKVIPLYIGLATGFCGSLTSFSSFARDAFLGLSNNLPTPLNHPNDFTGAAPPSATSTVSRNGGYSFQAWAAVVFATLALSLGGLMVGAHIALALASVTPRLPVRLTRRLIDPLTIFLGWGSWLGAVFLCIWPPDRPSGPASRGTWANEAWRGEVLFALVFAPVGCLLRFYASIKLNGLVPAFPLGTFAVNMLGTAVEGMCYSIQHVGVGIAGRVGGGRVGCQVLQGVMDGLCGTLTTVSTWVAEINGLRRRHGYLYALASVVGALCLMVVIMGSVKWSVGWTSPVCNTGYTDKIYG